MFQVALPLRPASFNKRQQKEKAFFQKHSWRAHVSPVFPSFPYGRHCFQCQRFCFQDANYAYATRQGILTKIRACEHLQNFGEHEQASTHVIFGSNSSKGQILRALSTWMGPFDNPKLQVHVGLKLNEQFLFSILIRIIGDLQDVTHSYIYTVESLTFLFIVFIRISTLLLFES